MKTLRTCKTCGSSFEFDYYPSQQGKKGTYCSLKCRGGNNKLSHGHSLGGKLSKTYTTWVNMVRRCTKPGHDKYHQYGAIGITVCDRWMKFENFLEDMGDRPDKCTIDRIDGSLGYFPENCRWADIKTQQRNLKSNVLLCFNGEQKCVSEWSEIYSLNKTLLAWRIRRGWPVEKALLTQPQRGRKI